MQTSPEGPSGEAVAGRDQPYGSLATIATLSNTILPVSALCRTQPLSNLPPFAPYREDVEPFIQQDFGA